jgi:hypothetical protein
MRNYTLAVSVHLNIMWISQRANVNYGYGDVCWFGDTNRKPESIKKGGAIRCCACTGRDILNYHIHEKGKIGISWGVTQTNIATKERKKGMRA